VHSSFLVTHPVAQTSLCASSPLAPLFSGPGSTLWPAIGAGSAPWQPCDTLAAHNGAGGYDYGIWKEQLTTMQTFALCASLHWQTATPPRSSKKPYRPDQKITRPANLKNPRTTRRKKSAVLKLLKKISARPNVIYTIFKSPLTSRARQRYIRCLRNSPSGRNKKSGRACVWLCSFR
jgi:hypothetical protein